MGPIFTLFKSRGFEFLRLLNAIITSTSIVQKNTMLPVKSLVLYNETVVLVCPKVLYHNQLPFRFKLETSRRTLRHITQLTRFYRRLLFKAASPNRPQKVFLREGEAVPYWVHRNIGGLLACNLMCTRITSKYHSIRLTGISTAII